MRSEKAIQDAIRKALREDGWLVAKAHGNRFQKGWPDLYCHHPLHGERWIEVKRSKGKLTKDQRRRFPEWAHYGVGIWVLTSETEIPLIWERPNWDQWL